MNEPNCPKALVIDDSKAVCKILKQHLGASGFEVETALNGSDGFSIMLQRGTSLSLALVDWNMPVMNGLEFVKRVRACPEFSGVRLIMVTTENEPEQISAALEAGADEYVMKPFTSEVLEDKLRMIGALND